MLRNYYYVPLKDSINTNREQRCKLAYYAEVQLFLCKFR